MSKGGDSGDKRSLRPVSRAARLAMMWDIFRRSTWRGRFLLGVLFFCKWAANFRFRRCLYVEFRGKDVCVELTSDHLWMSFAERRRRAWVCRNWTEVWPHVQEGLDTALSEYRYDRSLVELLSNENNKLSISVSADRSDPRILWSATLAIDKPPSGYHLAYADFGDEGVLNTGMMF